MYDVPRQALRQHWSRLLHLPGSSLARETRMTGLRRYSRACVCVCVRYVLRLSSLFEVWWQRQRGSAGGEGSHFTRLLKVAAQVP